MGGVQPGEFGGGRAFEVFGQAPASPEPCKGTLDDPALGQKLEAFDPESEGITGPPKPLTVFRSGSEERAERASRRMNARGLTPRSPAAPECALRCRSR